jgi:hypothetical protein
VLELPLVTGGGGEADEGRAPVAVDGDAHVEAQARGMPAMVFAFHEFVLGLRVRKYASGELVGQVEAARRKGINAEGSEVGAQMSRRGLDDRRKCASRHGRFAAAVEARLAGAQAGMPVLLTRGGGLRMYTLGQQRID